MTDVFMSHSYQDKPFVARLANRLRDEGLTVWLDDDDESLKPGADIVSSLSKAIDASRAVLVVLSDRTSKSDWLSAEAALALSHRDKLVVPIVATKSAEMPFMLRPLKAVDLSDDATFEDATYRLASFLKQQPDVQAQDPSARFARVAIETDALSTEQAEYAKAQERKNIRLIAGAASFIVAAAAATVAASLIFLKEKLWLSEHLAPLFFGLATGVAAHLLYDFVQERVVTLLTKRTGAEASVPKVSQNY